MKERGARGLIHRNAPDEAYAGAPMQGQYRQFSDGANGHDTPRASRDPSHHDG